MPRVLIHLAAASFCLALVAVAACSDGDSSGSSSGTTSSSGGTSSGDTGEPLANAKPVAEQYAKNVYANYSEVLTKAKAMQTAINAFVDAPSDAALTAAKTAWIAAREPYGPSEVYRFYGGPIDAEEVGPEGFINAWPLDENFIDYTRDEANAGIINKTAEVPEITKNVIRDKNESEGERTISTGYHAIEFLLWGQDSEDPADKKAGERPFTDYTTKTNADRRKQYLKLVTEILVEDLESVTKQWEPNQENYAKTFATDPKDAITKMLKIGRAHV